MDVTARHLFCSGRSFFMCRIDLTDEGHAHAKEAVAVVFRWGVTHSMLSMRMASDSFYLSGAVAQELPSATSCQT